MRLYKKSFYFYPRCRLVLREAEQPLLPKDKGTGSMIFAFVCCEHGLFQQIPMNILAEINLRCLGKNYGDKEAAIEVYGGRQKTPLTAEKSPFLVVFEYGETERDTGTMPTWCSSSKMLLMSCRCSTPHLTLSFYLITMLVTLNNELVNFQGKGLVHVGLFQRCIPKFELEREEGEGKLQCKRLPLSFRADHHSSKNTKVRMSFILVKLNRLNKAIPNMALLP